MNREQLEKELDNMLNELNNKIKGNKMKRDYTKSRISYKLTNDDNMRIKIRNISSSDMANAISSLARRIEADLDMNIGKALAQTYLERADIKEAQKEWSEESSKTAKLKVTFAEGKTNIKVSNMPGWGLLTILVNMIMKGIEEFDINGDLMIEEILKIDKDDEETRKALMKAVFSLDMDDILSSIDKMIDELKDKIPEKYSN